MGEIKNKNTIKILRIFLAFVFLSAAIYRIFNYTAAKQELINLNISTFFVIPVIIFEILIGLSFFFDKYVKIMAISSSIFLFLAILLGLFVNGSAILSQIGELFVFDPTSTDVFLHLTFLILIVVVFVDNKSK